MQARMIAKGTTDEITDCECCGRQDLKRTVRMVTVLDGEEVDEQFFGTTCAAKASGRPVGEVRREASAADREARQEELRRHLRAINTAPPCPWERFLAEHGTGDDIGEQIESLGGFAAAREKFAETA